MYKNRRLKRKNNINYKRRDNDFLVDILGNVIWYNDIEYMEEKATKVSAFTLVKTVNKTFNVPFYCHEIMHHISSQNPKLSVNTEIIITREETNE